MTGADRRDGAALLILRLGLVWFIFLWAAHKLITPAQYQDLARNFDGVDLSLAAVLAAGVVQIAICALAAAGAFRPFSYGALLLMHLFTVSRRWPQFLDPFAVNEHGFPINRNPAIDLAALGGFAALMLLIHRDHFGVGGWLARRGRGRWWM